MRHSPYLDGLRQVPAFDALSDHDLVAIGRLVDTVEVPSGTVLAANPRELVATLAPTSLLVIRRSAAEAVLQLAPALLASAARAGFVPRTSAARAT